MLCLSLHTHQILSEYCRSEQGHQHLMQQIQSVLVIRRIIFSKNVRYTAWLRRKSHTTTTACFLHWLLKQAIESYCCEFSPMGNKLS